MYVILYICTELNKKDKARAKTDTQDIFETF